MYMGPRHRTREGQANDAILETPTHLISRLLVREVIGAVSSMFDKTPQRLIGLNA